MNTTHRILSGVDLPFEPSCGSLILCDALYGDPAHDADAHFFALDPPKTSDAHATTRAWSQLARAGRLHTMPDHPSRTSADPRVYRDALRARLGALVDQVAPDVLHLNHLGFGMTATLTRTHAHLPALAICHGTALLAAQHDARVRAEVVHTLRTVDLAVFPTRAMHALATEIAGALPCDVAIIPWGIATYPETLPDRPAPATDRPLRVLYAGRATANKGIETLIRALSRVDPRHITAMIHCPEPAHAHLTALITTLEVHDRVTLGPFLPQRTLWARFHEHDVLVVPTRWVEAFGLIALEAQAHGLPVVYPARSGLAEATQQIGVSFRDDDPVDLASTLESLARDASRAWWHTLRAQGRDFAKNYTLRQTRSRLLECSHRIVHVRRDGSPRRVPTRSPG